MLLRSIFAVVIATMIAVAPVTSALAALSSIGVENMTGMRDCDGTGSETDCKCCEPALACPPAFCLHKCFKLVGEALQPSDALGFELAAIDAAKIEVARGQLEKPQPPPPRF
jgi:hypothetical protein